MEKSRVESVFALLYRLGATFCFISASRIPQSPLFMVFYDWSFKMYLCARRSRILLQSGFLSKPKEHHWNPQTCTFHNKPNRPTQSGVRDKKKKFLANTLKLSRVFGLSDRKQAAEKVDKERVCKKSQPRHHLHLTLL